MTDHFDCLFLKWLFQWQTLIGSLTGGIFALFTALIVARSARKRDELASGVIVSATLASVSVMSDTLAALAAQENITEETFPLWFSERAVNFHPLTPVLFDSSVARLASIDVSLAAHLALFQQTYSQVELGLKRVADDFAYYHMYDKAFRPEELMKADCQAITKHFQFAVKHANCAVYLIEELVFSKVACWHKLRRNIGWYNKKEKECMELLKKGG